VQRDGEDTGVIPEDTLRSVAVVSVDVDIRHAADAAVEQPLDGNRRIVVDAEAAGPFAGRVVHAATEVHGVER
jgi:hypothetical protein